MKTHLIIALLLVSSIVIAQNTEEKFNIPKNQWVLGGNVNFNHESSETEVSNSESKGSSWSINPVVGYFIKENLVVGLRTGFNFGNYEGVYDSGDNYERDFKGYNVSPYLRKYFSLSKKLAFNLEGGVMYSKRWDDNSTENNSLNELNKSNSSSLFIGITPGITYSLSNKVYLYSNLGNLGYYKNKWESDYETSTSDLFSFGLFTQNLNLGLLFIL